MKSLSSVPTLLLATGLFGFCQAEVSHLHAHEARNLANADSHFSGSEPIDISNTGYNNEKFGLKDVHDAKPGYGGKGKGAMTNAQGGQSNAGKGKSSKGKGAKGGAKGTGGMAIGTGAKALGTGGHKNSKTAGQDHSTAVVFSNSTAGVQAISTAMVQMGGGQAAVQLSFVTTTVFGTGAPPTVTVTPLPMMVTQLLTVTETAQQCAASAETISAPVTTLVSETASAALAASPPAAAATVASYVSADTSILTASGTPSLPAPTPGVPGGMAIGIGSLDANGACGCQCICGAGSFPEPAAVPVVSAGSSVPSLTTLATLASSVGGAGNSVGAAAPASTSAASVKSASTSSFSPISLDTAATSSVSASASASSVSTSIVATSSSTSDASSSPSSSSSSSSSTTSQSAEAAATPTPVPQAQIQPTSEAASLNLGKLTETTASGTPVTAPVTAAPAVASGATSISDPVNVDTSAFSSALVLGNLAAQAR